MGWRWAGTKNGRSWRSAKALILLGGQIEARWPNRDVTPDGTVASSGHTRQNPTSDHEPDVPPVGVVAAIDIAHNSGPAGTDLAVLFELLRLSRDPRIKYAIFDRRLFSSYDHSEGPAYTWREYRGSNPHTSHGHISVVADPALYDDDQTPWAVPTAGAYQEGETMILTDGQATRITQALLNLWADHRGVDLSPLDAASDGITVNGVANTETATALEIFRGWHGVTEPTGDDVQLTPADALVLAGYATPVIHEAIATDAELDAAWADLRADIAALELEAAGPPAGTYEAVITFT